MDFLSINRTAETPEIQFNSKNGILQIEGRSIPENANEFYSPILEWIRAYAANPAKETTFIVQLDYMNSISQKMLLDMLIYLSHAAKDGKSMHVKWHYEEDDEEMLEEGHIFQSKVDLPFEFIPVGMD